MTKTHSWIRRYGGRVLAVGVGMLAAFLLVELAGRVVLGWKPLPVWAQRFASEVGYELRPGETYVYASKAGEFEIDIRHNARGLRDVDHTLSKPPDTFRILILADSYGQAREVTLEQNFARQLEILLGESAPPDRQIEVINAGHFGLGTTQEYLYYTVEGYRYAPDLVLLGFYVGNDAVDNHAPLIEDWNQTSGVDFPYFDADGTLHQPGMTGQRRLLSWLRNNLYTVNVLSSATMGTGPVERVEVGDAAAVTDQALATPMGVYLPPDEVWAEAWAITGHALTLLQEAAESHGARFAVFVIPDRRQLYDDEWAATLTRLPDLNRDLLDRERPTRQIMDLLEAQNVAAFNLLDPFRTADERLYFAVDGHFTPEGHTVTAQALADWLIASDMVPVGG